MNTTPKFYDITLTLHPELPIWPGDPPPIFKPQEAIDAGALTNTTRLNILTHLGTHIDAPRHLFRDGTGVDELPLTHLIGEALVIEIPDAPVITAKILESLVSEPIERLLLKTRNSQFWARGIKEFQSDFTALAEDAAHWLVQRGVKLVGIDYLSIDRFEATDLPVHRILLAHQVIIVEGLNLTAVPPGEYQLICLPLKIVNGDGAPARVVLWEK